MEKNFAIINYSCPLISIVTVCLNCENHIEQTILSVLNQTYEAIEYIIIDGGSRDKTVDIIKKYEGHLTYWHSEKDEGIYDAMNKGIYHCNGDLISFLNGDDWYEKNTLREVAIKHLSEKKQGVIHGNIKVYNDNNFVKIMRPKISPNAKLYFAWHPAIFVPKGFFYQYGMFDKKYKIAGDVDFLLRLKKNNVNFYYLPKILTNFRLGGASDNGWHGSLESFEIYRRYFSLPTALILFWKRTVIRQLNSKIQKKCR